MSARQLGKHAVWNVAGQALPIVVAVAVLPLLVQRLGLDRYGFLTLVWVLVGYLGVFDFGVGRAMTRLVAERLGAGDAAGADAHARAALGFLLAMGLLLGAALALGAPAIVAALSLPAALEGEAANALRILALSLPLVMLTSGYRGYLEAQRAFGALNLIRVAMGVATYALPLLVTWFSARLEALVLSVLAMRLVANTVHRRVAARHSPSRLALARPRAGALKPLLQLGGWMTVSNVVSPLMNHVDRLLVGVLVPIAAVGLYATAYDVVTKVLILAYSLTQAAFPLFAGLQDPARGELLYATLAKVMLAVVWPVLFALSLVAGPLFGAWLGPDFVPVAAPALQILAIGLYFNALAQVPAMLIGSRGDPRWMALLHLAEAPVFIALMFALTQRFGVLGTAAAWALRAAVDSLAVHAIARRRLLAAPVDSRLVVAALVLAPLALLLPLADWTVLERVGMGALALAGFPLLVWALLLDARERQALAALLQSRLGRVA